MAAVGTERELLTITESERGWVLVGEIDASNTTTLGAALQILPEAAQASGGDDRTIEVDVSGVTFIDSSGLRTLVELAQRAQQAGRKVALTDTPSNVARLIEIAELGHLLDVRSGSPSVISPEARRAAGAVALDPVAWSP